MIRNILFCWLKNKMAKTKNILFHCLVLFGCAQTKLSLYLRFKIQTPWIKKKHLGNSHM